MPLQVKTFTSSRKARGAARARSGPGLLEQRRWERIYDVVRRIPKGRVATYGQVASLAGLPRHARQVGYALHVLPANTDVPWHRVINARGEVSARSTPGSDELQLALLRRERVLGRDGRVDLARFQWEPGD
jgi:methylated-DNA-protein-cysteine methyltransferase-like protein